MSLPALLLASGAHELEAAQTLIQAGQFVVILLIARALAELMVRLRLPAILGELVAGVLIGVSGLHLIHAPELGGESTALAQGSSPPWPTSAPNRCGSIYADSFPSCRRWRRSACWPCCSSPAWRASSTN